MRASLLLLLLLSLSSAARARPPIDAVSLGYFGETFTHPGLRVGAERTIGASGSHRLLGGLNLTTYVHPGFHAGLLADVELGYRYQFDGGFALESRLGAGYLHTFLGGTTFERGASGDFEEVSLASRSAFAPSLSVGAAYALHRSFDMPLSVFLRLTVFEQFPFNNGWATHVAGQLGASWQFGADQAR